MNKNFTYGGELYHYGVRGMRWRNRKTNTVSTNGSSGKTGRDIDVSGDPRLVSDKVTNTMNQLSSHGQQGDVVDTYKTGSGPKTRRHYVIRRRKDLKLVKQYRDKRVK